MEYFILKTDDRITRLPQIQIPKELSLVGRTREKIAGLTTPSIAYVKDSNGLHIDYPDYLDDPFPLIAESLKNILQKYQKDIVFHRVVLVEKQKGIQTPYFLMIPPEAECQIESVGKNRIFIAKDQKKQIVVRLDVAESILRRNANGIWFQPVEIQGGNN